MSELYFSASKESCIYQLDGKDISKELWSFLMTIQTKNNRLFCIEWENLCKLGEGVYHNIN